MLIKISAIVLFFFLFVIVIGITMIVNILRILFGSSKPASGNHKSDQSYHTHQADSRPNEPSPKKKKVFDDDEGEYVSFEEIKDDK